METFSKICANVIPMFAEIKDIKERKKYTSYMVSQELKTNLKTKTK